MLRFASFGALAAMLLLGACARGVPTGPAVLGLPPSGKDLAQFQGEDASCRAYAAQQIGAVSGARDLQPQYDAAYAQCMSSKGNNVQSLAMLWGFQPLFPDYYAGYYPIYGPLYAGTIFGFANGGGAHGHHHHHGFGPGGFARSGGGRGGVGHGGGARS